MIQEVEIYKRKIKRSKENTLSTQIRIELLASFFGYIQLCRIDKWQKLLLVIESKIVDIFISKNFLFFLIVFLVALLAESVVFFLFFFYFLVFFYKFPLPTGYSTALARRPNGRASWHRKDYASEGGGDRVRHDLFQRILKHPYL